MAVLRLVHSRPSVSAPDAGCLDSFGRELDYLYGTLQRLGVRAPDMEDLLQEIFLALYRNWPSLDLGSACLARLARLACWPRKRPGSARRVPPACE